MWKSPHGPRKGLPDEGPPDRSDFDPTYDPAGPIECEVCGALMEYMANCKIVCRNCGYQRDCSDP